jgi:hypothetical protein
MDFREMFGDKGVYTERASVRHLDKWMIGSKEMMGLDRDASQYEHAAPKIFWSWQSDYSETTCRHFIRDALAEAIAQAIAASSIEDADRPELDHDTKGERGMADIAVTILNKIAGAAIFVADLSAIGQSAGKKWLPNPNVMIELGWAMHRPGWERVIGVLNTASGAQVEDLPFDIRQRRIITYVLPENAGKDARKKVRMDLVKELKGAIVVNLQARAEEIASALQISRVEAKPDNPSIWVSAGATITHNNAFGGARRDTVGLPDVPRSYMRITPGGWRNGPPAIADIARLPQERTVDAPSEGGTSGNFGATEEGFVRYWIAGPSNNGTAVSTNLMMFFEETGEFWMLHGSVVAEHDQQLLLRDHAMLGWWSRTLRGAMDVMDQFGAREARVVEAGLFNVKDLRWFSEWASDRTLSRRNFTHEVRQSRDWSPSGQLTFLTDAYNRVRGLFALNRRTEAEVTNILTQVDPQRFATEERSRARR